MSDDRKPTTLAGGVSRAFAGMLANLHTVMPGVVESYDATTGRADVTPCMGYGILGADQKRTMKLRSTIPDVPVGFFGTAGGMILVPVAKGDEVLILICEGSIATWKGKRGGGKIDPGDDRRFNLSDAIAIPLVIHGTAALQIEFTSTKIRVGGSSALATKADLDNLRTWINTHVHVAPGGTTAAPTAPLAPAAVGTLVTEGG